MSAKSPYWQVQDLVFGIDANPTQKLLLLKIYQHTNAKKGYAWMSQTNLALEMGTSVSTVERAFAWAKEKGVVQVRRVRTGKGKDEQYNEYWLDLEQLTKLQRKHPASVMGGQDQQPALARDAESTQHPSSMTPSTRHSESEHPSSDAEAPSTSAGEGVEVKQVVSKADKNGTAGGEGYGHPPARISPRENESHDEIPDSLFEGPFGEERRRFLERIESSLNFHIATDGSLDALSLAGLRKLKQRESDALSIPFKYFCLKWDNAIRRTNERLTPPKPVEVVPPQPIVVHPPVPPKPKAVPTFDTDKRREKWKRSREFYEYASMFGWTPDHSPYDRRVIEQFLSDMYGVKTAGKLTTAQFTKAWRRIEKGPPQSITQMFSNPKNRWRTNNSRLPYELRGAEVWDEK